ncbi:PREDICTED: guanine nucleotide-binding protein subunit gamma 3-like isoform X2 [Tarenaya hassleriana]|uniref:guanine nucleotide-binding protein subunit gamma 3-like isoform X2 n=1 Tax=Tarenaya hassleriana TaxID=28532 RepID=UPI00053C8229|nr:PREDICTED: guanine nucleotide-binding protein subunit gamma 3-like isoform X2 [Tarenaya hassleriana]
MSSLEKRAAVVPPRGGGGTAVAPRTIPPPRPRSPPAYPDLYGRRREAARVQMLEREIGFLEAELKFIEGIQPASKYCKEVSDLVAANSDPLVPVQRKSRRPCRFWKWLCSGIPCLNLLSFFCCCQSECSCHLRRPECCSQPKCSCPSCPSGPDCCPKPSCGSCSRGCSCSSCSDMKPCCCVPRRCCCFSCQWLSCPNISSCCRCEWRWRWRRSSCFRCPKTRLCCCDCRYLCSNPCCLFF